MEVVKLCVAEGEEDPDTLGLGKAELVVQGDGVWDTEVLLLTLTLGSVVLEEVTQLDSEGEPDADTLGEGASVPVLQPVGVVEREGDGESVEVTQPDLLTDPEDDPDTLGVSSPEFEPEMDTEAERESKGVDESEVVREAVTHSDPDGL